MFPLRDPRDLAEPVQPPWVKPRSKDDIVFNDPIYLHSSGKRYTWDQTHTYLFRRHIEENPDDYYNKVDLLLIKLKLGGYENIQTVAGVDYKRGILLPKVMEKLMKMASDIFKPGGDWNPLAEPVYEGKIMTTEFPHSKPETIRESPQGSPVLGHGERENEPHNEHRINSTPVQLRRINKMVSKLHRIAQSLRMFYSDLPNDHPLAVSLYHHKNIVRHISDQVEDRVDEVARTWLERHRDPRYPMLISSDEDNEDPR